MQKDLERAQEEERKLNEEIKKMKKQEEERKRQVCYAFISPLFFDAMEEVSFTIYDGT